METHFGRKVGLLLPVWWINENNLWSCFEAYSNIVGLLHMLEELSFPPSLLNTGTY